MNSGTAGDHKQGRRSGPLSIVYVPWVTKMREMGVIGTSACVMLMLMSRMSFDGDGNAVSWYPRSEMAEEIGVSENAVREAIKGLKRSGALRVRERGRNGLATVYDVMPGSPWPELSRGVSEEPKGGSHKTRKGGFAKPLPNKGASPPNSTSVRDRASARLAPPRELDEF